MGVETNSAIEQFNKWLMFYYEIIIACNFAYPLVKTDGAKL